MNKTKLLNGNILVEFEECANLKRGVLDLVIAERYLIQEADQEGEHDAYGVTTDRRLINPQTVKIIEGNDEIPDGTRCFVHYGAWEIAQWWEGQAIIPARTVFFKLDPITPFEGNYLGHEVFKEGERTDSGIYLTPYAEIKLPCNIKIIHVPENSGIKVGDEVITVDAAQYQLNYEGEKFIKLKDSEIIARVINGETIPYGNYMLVEYVEEPDQEREAHNDYMKHIHDVATKHRLFLKEGDIEVKQPPKDVDVKVLALGNYERKTVDGTQYLSDKNGLFNIHQGDTIKILRNKGVPMDNGKWIINTDTILWVLKDMA